LATGAPAVDREKGQKSPAELARGAMYNQFNMFKAFAGAHEMSCRLFRRSVKTAVGSVK